MFCGLIILPGHNFRILRTSLICRTHFGRGECKVLEHIENAIEIYLIGYRTGGVVGVYMGRLVEVMDGFLEKAPGSLVLVYLPAIYLFMQLNPQLYGTLRYWDACMCSIYLLRSSWSTSWTIVQSIEMAMSK